MFTNRTMIAALFTIAIASSLIAAACIVNSAFADTRKSTSQSYLLLPITVGGQSDNSGMTQAMMVLHQQYCVIRSLIRQCRMVQIRGDSDWTTEDNNTIPEKYLNGLSNCESSAAADGHLTPVEIMDCFYKVF